VNSCVFAGVIAVLMMAGQPGTVTPQGVTRIIIDTDPGTDDALAILMALNSPELNVEAITVVAGNVPGPRGLDNALRLVSLAGHSEIPVAGGALRPLLQKLVTAETHGADGLAGIRLPAPRSRPDPRFAADLIIELVRKYPREITLVPLGPLTNIALALRKDPSIAALVKQVVLMGGAITGGNVDAVAEFNIYVDPEAAQIVFNAGWPLTMVGLELGRKALFNRDHLARLRNSRGMQSELAAGILEHHVILSEKYGLKGAPLYDPTAMAAVIDRTLITTQAMHVDVELRGEHTRGETVANRQNALNRKVPEGDHLVFRGTESLSPNTDVAIDIDRDRFFSLFISRLSRASR
jgi:inosine-uridine nucleoside N-ribohydrolase